MPLVDTKKMFSAANKHGFAVGAFNVNNMELLQGIIEACQEKKSPLILQISKGARKYANMRYLRALIDVAVAESGLPVVIHLDHGDTFELCKQCIDEGFTSVMIDGSHFPYEENVAQTKKVCDYAHNHKPYVSVEAELGRLGGIEEEVVGVKEEDLHKFLTDPNQAEDFVKRTGCDSLAVACGTSHGAYKFKTAPKLAFDLLEDISRRMPGFPLVMHGSSSVPQELIKMINQYGGKMPNAMGVPEEALTKAGKMGVCKINIDTDLRLALTAAIRKVFAEKPSEFDPRNYLGPGRDAVKMLVAHKVEILGCAGKADLCM
ncbi:MAG: class II fructose-1,6-bisphosphate aldolase [Phycisphaerae bacterium]